MAWPTKTDFVDGDVLTAAQVNNIGTNLNLANPTGITDGYVLTANGANSMGWEAVDAASYTLISSGTISSASTVTISSIPATYKHVELWIYSLSLTSNDQMYVDGLNATYPGGAGTSNSNTISASGITVAAEDSASGSYGFVRLLLGERLITNSNARNFFVGRWYDYASTTIARKIAHGFGAYLAGASASATEQATGVGQLTTLAAINQIRIFFPSATISSGNWQLWGIK